MDSTDVDNLQESVKDETSSKKEQWDRKMEYILSVFGYLVGFGNILRFPYVCMRNGGGAFLIPYVLSLLLMGIPLYFLEASLGQFTGKSFKEVWSYCPIIQGLNACYQVLIIPSTCYYAMLMTWTLYYFYQSFHYPLPWSTCGNEWNTPYCVSDINDEMPGHLMANTSYLYNMTSVMNTSIMNATSNDSHHFVLHSHSAEEEYWQQERQRKIKVEHFTAVKVIQECIRYKVLDISSGLVDIGSMKGNLVLCLSLSWLFVYLCVSKGIKTSGKVVYLTATLPYLLLTILLVHNLTLPGSLDGVVFFIKPDFESLKNIQVWLEAAIQVFYSLGIGWGGLIITLSSYNKFNNNCLRDSFLLAIAGEGTSVFGGFVIFSALGFMAHKANVPVAEVVKSGPGLGFVAYPMAIAQMPLPNFWAVLFFFAMITLGLDTQFTLVEVTYSHLEHYFPFLEKRQMISRACLSCLGILFGLPFCTQGGVYLYQLMDWYCAAFAPIFFTIVECISISWVYGAERFSRDVEMMIGRRIPLYIKLFWSFFLPLMLCVLMVTSLIAYEPPTYGDYVYPGWAENAGWIYAVLPIVPFFTVGFSVLYNSPGKTVYQKLRQSVLPTKDWHPSVDKADYLALSWNTGGTFTQRFLFNLGFGKQSAVV